MTAILASWKDTPTKRAILDFVAAVTDESGPDYVPPVERIATFDNDGTLWCEHPVPVQIVAVLDGLTRAVQQNPALGEQPLYRAAVEKDMAWFAPYMSNERIPELIGMMLARVRGPGRCLAGRSPASPLWHTLHPSDLPANGRTAGLPAGSRFPRFHRFRRWHGLCAPLL
jgi:hypothetical protein